MKITETLTLVSEYGEQFIDVACEDGKYVQLRVTDVEGQHHIAIGIEIAQVAELRDHLNKILDQKPKK